MVPPPLGSVEYWRSLVLGRLPPVDQVLARNYALTAQYARWYQAHPAIFKWAGMAAFSSRRVGLALTPYQMVVDVEQLLEVAPNAGQIIDIRNPDITIERKSEILPGLNILRQTNNAVFEDIGWVHEAYAQGGIAAVEAAIGTNQSLAKLKLAFGQLDAGSRLQMQGNTVEAYELIWKGTWTLVDREQRDIIQPRLDRATVLFETFLSSATILQYWANPFHVHPNKMTVFPLATLVFNWRILLHQKSLPEFRDLEQRLAWIFDRVVPIFQRLDGSDPEINASIEEIIAAGSQILLPVPHTTETIPIG
jgi:hypothetical protein